MPSNEAPENGSHSFALRLAAIRGRARNTKARLADMSGIPLKTIAQLEDGEVEPSWVQVQLIAKAFGRSALSFVDPTLKLPGTRLYKTV